MKRGERRTTRPNRPKDRSFGEWAERIKRKNVVCWYGLEMLRHFFADKLTRASAELSYYLLFSIFPLLVLVSLLLSMTLREGRLTLCLNQTQGKVDLFASPYLSRLRGPAANRN